MLRKLFATPFGKITFLLLLTVVFVFGASWYMRPRPDERNRIVAPAGYSIIHPDGWSAEIHPVVGAGNSGDVPVRDILILSPDRFLGNAPKISIRRLAAPPDLAPLRAGLWSDGLFQGSTALVLEHKVKRSVVRSALFERAGQWFELAETLPNAESIRADDWWRFVETFRYPEPGVTLPATMNATAPAPSTEPFSLPPADQ